MLGALLKFFRDRQPMTYAKVGVVSYHYGVPVHSSEIEVIDRKTGKPPVDAKGRELGVVEIDTRKGWLLFNDYEAWNYRNTGEIPTIRLEGDFELRDKTVQ